LTQRDFCLTGITVNLPPNDAWARFVEHMHVWWPREYTWSKNDLDWIGFRDGRCMEINKEGGHQNWGEVISATDAENLTFSWNIGPDSSAIALDDDAGNVSVSFSGMGQSATRVSVMHSGFQRYGNGWEDYLRDMASDMGWKYILTRYADLTAEQ